MTVFNRLFRGSARHTPPMPAPYIQFQNEAGTEQVLMVPDTSAGAIAARQSFGAIYGMDNIPPEMTMRAVIQVKDPETGEFVPVTGNRRAIPGSEAQLAALQAFRESGIIGPQPINENGSNATPTDALAGTMSTSTSGGVSDSADNNVAPPSVLEPEAPLNMELPILNERREVEPVPGGLLDRMTEVSPSAASTAVQPAEAATNNPHPAVVSMQPRVGAAGGPIPTSTGVRPGTPAAAIDTQTLAKKRGDRLFRNTSGTNSAPNLF